MASILGNKIGTKPAPASAAAFAGAAATPPAPQVDNPVRSNPRIVIRKLSSQEKKGLKIMLFGPSGTGKTYALKDLVEMGLKVLVLTTDIGGSGLNAIEIPLRAEGKHHLLDNILEIQLPDYPSVEKFLKDPTKFINKEQAGVDLYDWDPDVLFWDGFSSFQQIDIQEYIGAMEAGKKSTEQRVSGLRMEQSDWGDIRNATVRAANRFCELNNRKTGKIWHKIFTSLESVKSKPSADNKSVLEESKEPALQGAGAIFVKGAFDLVIKTKVVIKNGGSKDEDPRAFTYVIFGHENLASKVRGFQLPPSMPANFGDLFRSCLSQLGMKVGDTGTEFIEPDAPAEETEKSS